MYKKPIPLIYNPTAGSLRRDPAKIDRLVDALRVEGMEVELRPTGHAGHATELAHESASEGAEIVIVCGGDGTINEAAQALVGTGTTLAVLPSGTANVFAKEMDIPRDPRQLARLIAGGKLKTISAGRAFKPETGWQRYFLLMAGIGLDATIVQGVNLEMKRKAGIGAYLASGLGYLAKLPLTPFSIDFNGKRHESTFAVISNSANYAVWFTLAPDARMDDDKLDICLFNSRSRLAYLAYALLSMLGNHIRASGVIYEETQEAKANSNNAALVQLDGEVVGNLPMKFDILPQSLKVIAP